MARIDKPLDKIKNHDDVLVVAKALYDDAKNAAEPFWKKADRNWCFSLGDDYIKPSEEGYETYWQDTDEENPAWRHRVHRDITRQSIEAIRPILMRGYPKYIIDADYPDKPAQITTNQDQFQLPHSNDRDIAQRWTEIYEHILEDRQEGFQIAKLLFDVLVTGSGFRRIRPNLARNRIDIEQLHYKQVLPDPHGVLPDFTDSKYVFIETEMDADDVVRLYGVKQEDFVGHNVTDRVSRLKNRVGRYFGFSEDQVYSRRRVPVWTLYYNQGTPREIIETDKRPKSLDYPNGRVIVIVNEQLVVYDEHFKDFHGAFPIVQYQAYPVPHKFYGATDTDGLVSIQQTTNILYSMVVMNAILSANSQWLYEEDVLTEGYLTNQPGLGIPVRKGALRDGAIERLRPDRIPADVIQMVQELEAFGKEGIAQITPALQGKQPGPNASGVLAQRLQEASLSPQTFKMEMLDQSYRYQAWLECSMQQQYLEFDDPRLLRDHRFGEALMWTEAIRELFYDIKVESKADLPHNVAARLDLGFAMLQHGVYDMEEFVDFTGVRVRPALRQMLRDASESFIPGVPRELQAQFALQSASQGSNTGSPRALPRQAQPTTGGVV